LIAAATDKAHMTLAQFLSACGVKGKAVRAFSGAEARRVLAEGAFDLILVNAPLPDEFGTGLAQAAAQQTIAGVILLVKTEVAEAATETVEGDGVFAVAKPVSRQIFSQALHMARATHARLSSLQNENRRLQKRIEDIRLVDRAKCLLIECCAMTEPEAHAYIERKAMDKRLPKRKIAEQILNGE